MDREESISFAKKYLEDMLSFFSANLTVDASCDEDVIELSVPSSPFNSILIGRNADTLRSFQYIISTVLRNKNAELNRVNIDIAHYKKQHADKIAEQAEQWIAEVRKTGNSKVLELNPADRRVVHGVASNYSDIQTHSEGFGRERKLVISQISS